MKELEVAIEAAKAAGEILRKEYQKTHTIKLKADSTPVSEVDLAAEKAIMGTIKQNFPGHAIFSEEAGSDAVDSEYLWIIDPLDGSNNFLRRLGNFCVAIALVKKNQPLAAAVYLPLTDELFAAETGQPATLNGQAITISETARIDRAFIAWGRGTVNHERHTLLYAELMKHVNSIRLIGSVVINSCYTADGRFDAFLNSDCKLYDAIAGAIIASASGAKITDFSGNPWQPNFSDPTSASDILISNPHIHSALVAALQAS